LDDITVLGDAAEVKAACRYLFKELKRLDLVVNKDKTKAYGCNSEYVANSLGCKRAPDGLRILGAWISKEKNAAKFARSRLDEYRVFFERVPKLSTDVAYAALYKCGPARWNFMARTHPPEEISEVTASSTSWLS
jgi:hypothetical protein